MDETHSSGNVHFSEKLRNSDLSITYHEKRKFVIGFARDHGRNVDAVRKIYKLLMRSLPRDETWKTLQTFRWIRSETA